MRAILSTCLLLAFSIFCQAQKKTCMNYPPVSESIERIDSAVAASPESSQLKPGPNNSQYAYVKAEAGYSLRISYPGSYFSVLKNYYPNGSIRNKGVAFNTGDCPLGAWYFFEQDGRLNHKTDYDQGYSFTIDQLTSLLKAQKIQVVLGKPPAEGKPTQIYKGVEGNLPVWYVHWLITPDKIEIMTISGSSGKVISKTYQKYNNS